MYVYMWLYMGSEVSVAIEGGLCLGLCVVWMRYKWVCVDVYSLYICVLCMEV